MFYLYLKFLGQRYTIHNCSHRLGMQCAEYQTHQDIGLMMLVKYLVVEPKYPQLRTSLYHLYNLQYFSQQPRILQDLGTAP